MALSTQPYKGTRDFYPEDMRVQRYMFNKMRKVAESYGYQEYDGPMLEPFELYAAKTGEEIVNQQLYWLIDRGERKMAIRPEMTPTLARMVAGKINELPRPVRWYAIPNFWRYERPQRGRLREFWQLNVDVLGGDPLLADAEILSFAIDLVREFGGEQFVSIKVNNRRLIDHFFEKIGLTADAALKATKALDARAKIGEEAYTKWLTDLGLSSEQQAQMEKFFHSSFEQIAANYPCQGVDELKSLFALMRESGAGDRVQFDPMVLRGLDYYTGTVFEMYDISPENNRAMFGGGRYDNLVGLFGNHKLSGVGLGWGDVTLKNFLETHGLLPKFDSAVDVFVTLPKMEYRSKAEEIVRALRSQGLKVSTPLSADGFGAQLKLANKHGARVAVLLGDTELAQGQVVVKNLQKVEQTTLPITGLAEKIAEILK
jgi:histidyl-tRNA synthetase